MTVPSTEVDAMTEPLKILVYSFIFYPKLISPVGCATPNIENCAVVPVNSAVCRVVLKPTMKLKITDLLNLNSRLFHHESQIVFPNILK